MGEEDRVENLDHDVYGLLWDMLQALFGIPFATGAWLTLRPLLAS